MTKQELEKQMQSFLLVEDNDAHAKLTTLAFKRNNIYNTIDRVKDGKSALNYVFKKGKYKNKKTPGLILLDLNIPEKDGIEVLTEIKADKTARIIPIVILTTSNSFSDIQRAYLNYANSYLVKPINFEKFNKMVKDLGIYWSVWNVSLLHA